MDYTDCYPEQVRSPGACGSANLQERYQSLLKTPLLHFTYDRRVLGDGHGGHVHPPKIFNLIQGNCNVCKYALKFKKGCKQIAENCRGAPLGSRAPP